MIAQKQLNRHDPDNGVYGDCFRTCVASLLDLTPLEVPHFHPLGDNSTQDAEMNGWLAGQGLVLISCMFIGEQPLDELLEAISGNHPGLHYLLAGMSRTGVNHSVVVCDGRIVSDPSLDDAGIVGPCDDGNWWITFMGKLV